jgi:hypothetical protein
MLLPGGRVKRAVAGVVTASLRGTDCGWPSTEPSTRSVSTSMRVAAALPTRAVGSQVTATLVNASVPFV